MIVATMRASNPLAPRWMRAALIRGPHSNDLVLFKTGTSASMAPSMQKHTQSKLNEKEKRLQAAFSPRITDDRSIAGLRRPARALESSSASPVDGAVGQRRGQCHILTLH